MLQFNEIDELRLEKQGILGYSNDQF